ncbi:MAG: NAD-dependent epimerase/dehydratase family protein [candidate division KSB1 bacterium]|nr:NAD-dependent epimerase/dehydratase family protein [candidate division KSB1 bacterium]
MAELVPRPFYHGANRRVLVTGGAGFIGSHLVDALLERGYAVRVYDNLEPQVHGGLREEGKWPAYLSPEAERILGDIRDREALRRALRDVDVVVHLAARVGVGQSMYEIEPYVDVNVRGTAVLLDLLANERHRVRRLVVASSMSAYGEGQYECPRCGVVYPAGRSEEQLRARDWEVRCPHCGREVSPQPTPEEKPLSPASVYAVSKRDQEEMCLAVGRAYGLPTVALRLFNVYGPRQALSNPYTGVVAVFSSRLLNGNPPVVYEDGQQRRDFLHVSDAVQAFLLAMEETDAAYGALNVGSGRPITIREVAETLIAHLGSPLQPEVSGQYRAGDVRHCFPTIERLQAIGYRPHVTFAEGIGETVEWVREQVAVDRFATAQQELERRRLAV